MLYFESNWARRNITYSNLVWYNVEFTLHSSLFVTNCVYTIYSQLIVLFTQKFTQTSHNKEFSTTGEWNMPCRANRQTSRPGLPDEPVRPHSRGFLSQHGHKPVLNTRERERERESSAERTNRKTRSLKFKFAPQEISWTSN